MVKDPGAASRAHHLRALNEPKSINVITKGDLPIAIVENESRHDILQIQDTWIIQDEWWRQEMHRQYYCLLLDNGTLHTIYHDRIADTWFEQAY
jgi:hypothetical protein